MYTRSVRATTSAERPEISESLQGAGTKGMYLEVTDGSRAGIGGYI